MKVILNNVTSNFLGLFKIDDNTNTDFIPFFRIAVGSILLLLFLSTLPDFELLYGMNSVVPTDIHTLFANGNLLYYNEIIDFLNRFFWEDISILIYKIIFILSCVCVIVGLYTRFFALVLLVINTALVKSSGYYTYGVDYFISMSLVYIILYPSDSYYSLRSKFSRKLRKTNFLIVKRTMQFHLCFAYMISGLEKLSGYNWRNGESIWKAIHLPNFDNDFNVNVDFLGKYPIIFVVIGWLTIIIELLYPLFTSIKKTREMWLYLTIGLHLSIVLFLNLYFFSAIMIIWNITTFYSFDKK